VNRWTLLALVAIALGAWVESTQAKPIYRQLAPADKPTYVMDCGRWSALLLGANKVGLVNFITYMNANPTRFTPNDVKFLKHEISPLVIELGENKISFADAMYICGAAIEL